MLITISFKGDKMKIFFVCILFILLIITLFLIIESLLKLKSSYLSRKLLIPTIILTLVTIFVFSFSTHIYTSTYLRTMKITCVGDGGMKTSLENPTSDSQVILVSIDKLNRTDRFSVFKLADKKNTNTLYYSYTVLHKFKTLNFDDDKYISASQFASSFHNSYGACAVLDKKEQLTEGAVYLVYLSSENELYSFVKIDNYDKSKAFNEQNQTIITEINSYIN